MKKIIIFLILSCISLLTYSVTTDNKMVVENYVNQLIQDGLDVCNDNTLDQDTKTTKIKKLILANLDLNWMAKFTIGICIKTLTPEQIERFTKVYSNYVSKTYANLLKNYCDHKLKVQQIRILDQKEFMVEMLVGATKVNYLVRQVNDTNSETSFKVSDIITENISLISSQQSEFMSIVNNSGFDKLVEEIIKKS